MNPSLIAESIEHHLSEYIICHSYMTENNTNNNKQEQQNTNNGNSFEMHI